MNGLYNGLYDGLNNGLNNGLNDGLNNGLRQGLFNNENTNNAIVLNGLVFYLDASNRISYPGAGILWRDISGNGNNGRLTNGPTFNTEKGGSIVFDGVNDRVTANAITVTNWTVQVWLKSSSVGGNFKGIFEFALTLNGRTGLGLDTTGKPLIAYAPSSYNVSGGISIDNNKWCCLTGTFSGSPILYLNGIPQTLGSTLLSINTNTLNTIVIGDFTLIPTFLFPFNGNIAFVAFYNRALSPQEVLQNFNATRVRFGL
jgi:hypothetical protein